jgi:hypothetical protein
VIVSQANHDSAILQLGDITRITTTMVCNQWLYSKITPLLVRTICGRSFGQCRILLITFSPVKKIDQSLVNLVILVMLKQNLFHLFHFISWPCAAVRDCPYWLADWRITVQWALPRQSYP